MARKVSIVGMGPGDSALITHAAIQALSQAQLVVGARRLLDSLPDCGATKVAAVAGKDVLAALDNGEWDRAVVALSGDVGMFSGARGLAARVRAQLGDVEVATVPGISSMQCLAAALERPWQDWRFISAHGVDCDLVAEARAHDELFLVTGGQNTVPVLCERLVEAGLGQARVSVGERLGYPEQRVVAGTAEDLAGQQFEQLSVMLVEAFQGAGADGEKPEVAWPWATPGIPDELFMRSRVPMTKQEVRAASLAKLRVATTDVVWDVGAGTGSVSIECALLAKLGRVFAIERKAEAVKLVRENARRFGLSNVEVVEGLAPDALHGLPAPDAVFVGGSAGTLAQVLEVVRAANPAVRVCVSAITVETLTSATQLLAQDGWEGLEVSQVQASRADVVAGYHLMRAQNPVFLVSARGRA
ncbi:precorrin-6y C5,15-methyltransferase (decarboxylating) subunit CbiE [Paratractidigestivibacter sp.]|uniref:precorrin-6y C5,15-methyltransferase (decarboxylating) subunit CbiE n=2 Tax=Paratractidigestivibacter sp. TaxID=2847316 RepID=UPI002ABD6CE2|nr:precorrin-6y C5,15-methyltransferase (decarboxylating) subunit CbiE [Paratractidigestivibacter sp.]